MLFPVAVLSGVLSACCAGVYCRCDGRLGGESGDEGAGVRSPFRERFIMAEL